MSEEKKVIPYKVQKGNRPKIEEVISACLSGDLKDTALDFAIFMRENKMPFKLKSSSTRMQVAEYKSEHICHVFIYAEDDWQYGDQHNQGDPQYWSVTPILNNINKYEGLLMNQEMQNILWNNINYCRHYNGNGIGCNPNKGCAGGRDLTLLGKKFNGIAYCYPHSRIKNPNATAIANIKKLLELEQKARKYIY